MTRGPEQQWKSELFFKVSDMRGKSGLGEANAFCCFTEMQFFGDG